MLLFFLWLLKIEVVFYDVFFRSNFFMNVRFFCGFLFVFGVGFFFVGCFFGLIWVLFECYMGDVLCILYVYMLIVVNILVMLFFVFLCVMGLFWIGLKCWDV